MHGLIGPKATKVEWRLQLRLVEADHLRSVVFQEIIYDLLLGLRVQTSDIEGDQLELLPFSLDSGEIPVDSGSLSVGGCVSSTVPVASSIPIGTIVFCFDSYFFGASRESTYPSVRFPVVPLVFSWVSCCCCASR